MKGKITDKTGKETLDVIAEADRFNEWMFKTIKPFSKGRILEIGSGLGNISDFFIKNKFEITLTDLRPEYLQSLSEKYENQNNLLGIEQVDLIHPEFLSVYKNQIGKYDTVFALNVIEHIEDDKLAIKNAKALLRKGGHLIILVPSYQLLYNRFDVELGHYRRYTPHSLSVLFKQNKMEIIHQQNFNFIGMFGWFFSGRILRKRTIPKSQMKFYNRMVPLWKVLDGLIKNQMGLSTIVIGKK